MALQHRAIKLQRSSIPALEMTPVVVSKVLAILLIHQDRQDLMGNHSVDLPVKLRPLLGSEFQEPWNQS